MQKDYTSSSDSILDLDLSAMSKENLAESLIHPELPNYGPFSLPAEVHEHVAIANAADERKRKYIGVGLALFLGCILGNCLTPYVLWQQSCTAVGGCNPLNFLFSQCMGIYVTSTVCFLIYASFFRYHKRSMPRSAMRPAYVSGLLWAMGLAGQLLSAGNLGFDMVYPLTSIGPAMVSMLWSAIYFKEIEGKRNMTIMAIGTAMIVAGTALRAIAA
ncbi:hypothetical protein DYB32_002930 [Aphanomyces invadans]|nr:hypothetical protein DYB32_002930 [Aphanomyces invadans]